MLVGFFCFFCSLPVYSVLNCESSLYKNGAHVNKAWSSSMPGVVSKCLYASRTDSQAGWRARWGGASPGIKLGDQCRRWNKQANEVLCILHKTHTHCVPYQRSTCYVTSRTILVVPTISHYLEPDRILLILSFSHLKWPLCPGQALSGAHPGVCEAGKHTCWSNTG